MKKYRFGHRGWVIAVFVVFTIGSAIGGAMTYFTGQLTDYGMAQDLENMKSTAIIIMAIAAAYLIYNGIAVLIQTQYYQSSMSLMKETYIRSILKQDIMAVQKDKVSLYLSNLTNDFDRYESKFMDNLIELAAMISQFLISVALLYTVNPYLSLVAIGLIIIFWGLSNRTGQPVKKTEEKKSQSLQAYTDFINESFTGFEIIKQHQMEESREQVFLKHAKTVQDDNYAVDVKTTHSEALNSFILNAVMMSIIVLGMIFALRTDMSLGGVVIVFSAFSNVMWPIQGLSRTIAEMTGISEVLDQFDKNLTAPSYDRPLTVEQFERLNFNQNDLGYDSVILADVDMTIERSQKVLIIGPSGAGKSTILKTLRQSTEALKNKVELNGLDIRKINPLDYYGLYSIVDQIGFLFSGSLKENISLYQDRSETEIQDIMKRVGLEKLDLDLEIQNDGSNLSGGQRARVMLARALCLNSQIILCDEIFASLDQDIARSIEHDFLSFDKTVINVSHIMFEENLPLYDKIYIVDNGKVKLVDDLCEVHERMLEFEGKVNTHEPIAV